MRSRNIGAMGSAGLRSLRDRYANAFRLASALLVLYALGHTMGAVVAVPRFGDASDTVVALMQSVHVRSQGADCTWYGFYRGFGMLVTVFFVLSAVLAWHLGGLTLRAQRDLAPVAWTLFASHVAGAVVTWVYFFPAPIVFSTLIAALLGVACLRSHRSGQTAHALSA
jgi:hypothetical protein